MKKGERSIISPDSIRFVTDSTVGKTAKWLRILGFDTLLIRFPNEKLLSNCLADGRIFITRDFKGACRKGMINTFFPHTDIPEEQLADILKRLGLREYVLLAAREALGEVSSRPQPGSTPIKILSLCIRCNKSLLVANRSRIADEVPDFTWSTQTRFQRCPECHRVYWGGTHKEGILRKIKEICLEVT